MLRLILPGLTATRPGGRVKTGLALWLAAMPLATSVTACRERLTLRECDAMLDRYLEHLVEKRRPETGAGEVERLKNEARALAHEDPTFEFDSCPAKISRSQYECAMSAPTVDDIERCLVF